MRYAVFWEQLVLFPFTLHLTAFHGWTGTVLFETGNVLMFLMGIA